MLFFGSDHMSLPTLKALQSALQPQQPRSSAHLITSLGVLCPGSRPVGRGQAVGALPVAAYAALAGLPMLEVPYGVRDLAGGPFGHSLAHFLHGGSGSSSVAYDVGVVVSFGYKLPASLLDALPLGAINLHPSALPRHRGAAPVAHTLLAGDAATAVSVIEVHPTRIDAGNVLAQEPVAIDPGMGAPALSARLAEHGAAVVLRTVQSLAAARASAVVQDESLVTKANKVLPEHGRVQWATVTPSRLVAMARAFEGSVGVHCLVAPVAEQQQQQQQQSTTRIKLLDIAPAEAGIVEGLPGSAAPGSLAFVGRLRRLFASCGERGWVELRAVQLEGKGAVSGAAFALGRHAKASSTSILNVALH